MTTSHDLLQQLENEGITYLRNKLDLKTISEIFPILRNSFEKHYSIQVRNGVENPSKGVALNCLADSSEYLDFLEKIVIDEEVKYLLESFLGKSFILNSFSALNTLKDEPNFSINVHRDIRHYSGNFNAMTNMLVMLDEFSIDSGSTRLFPKSHKSEHKPTDDEFMKNCIFAEGNPGDILVFNSNIWHASSLNVSGKPRRSIAITFSKPFIKQLVDYTKMMSVHEENCSPHMRQILGYNHRVAENLNQWYVPTKDRMYKNSY